MSGGAVSSARLFIAFDLPNELVAGLERWQASAVESSTWRAISPETLHLTLVFLGRRPINQIGAIRQALERSLPRHAPKIELAPDPVGIPKRRPRALALEARAPDVARMATNLASELVRAQLHEPERRRFWPHLTVARVKTDGRRRRPAVTAAALPAALRGPWTLDSVVLYRSETRADGARHEPEAGFRLRQ